MPDILAIISKAVFEKTAGKHASVGDTLGMDRYVSTNKVLEPLAAGGTLYLVTVRPDDVLWLVAVLERPTFDGAQWVGEKSTIPITDISHLKTKLKFESGTGITAAPGQLGMSLQTPRKLTKADCALLDGTGAAAPRPADIVESSGGRSDAVLGAILADPDDDAARRVLADALMQRNDPRGELILCELALHGPLSIRKRDSLVARRTELLRAHGKDWFPYKLADYRTSRGFLYAVTGSLSQISSEMFDREPIVEVEVTGASGDKLAKAKWLPRVRHLIVRGELGDDGFAALVASSGAQTLEALNVTNTELSGEAMEALDGHLPACKSLVLTSNELGDDGVGTLSAWTHIANLEKLYLSSCGLGDDAPANLFGGGGSFPALHKLCMSKNDALGDGGVAAFVSNAARLPALGLLELAGTGVSMTGVDALMKAKLPSTMRLDVRRNGIASSLVAKFGDRVRAGDGRD